MKKVLKRIDSLLGRVPVDSVHGRRLRQELLDHFEDSTGARVAKGADLAHALDEALDGFGDPAELERDYYRDYLRARFLWSLFDRELVQRPDRLLLVLGSWLLAVGLLLHLFVPTLAAYAGGMGVSIAEVNRPPGEPAPVPETFATSVEVAMDGRALLPLLHLPWHLLAVAGLAALTAAGLRVVIRARLARLARGASVWLIAAVPAVGLGFLLAADPETYRSGLLGALLSVADVGRAAVPLYTANLVAFGLIGLVLAAALVLLLLARRLGRADTVHLRQTCWALLGTGAGSVLLAHPVLLSALSDMEAGRDVPPVELLAALQQDLLLFLLGAVLVVGGTFRLRALLEDLDRTVVARS